jgi:hypothetical protein
MPNAFFPRASSGIIHTSTSLYSNLQLPASYQLVPVSR